MLHLASENGSMVCDECMEDVQCAPFKRSWLVGWLVGWVGLSWAGLGWAGWGGVGLGCVVLCCVALCCVVLCCVGWLVGWLCWCVHVLKGAIYTWNPNGAPCFYWNSPCFAGLKPVEIQQ